MGTMFYTPATDFSSELEEKSYDLTLFMSWPIFFHNSCSTRLKGCYGPQQLLVSWVQTLSAQVGHSGI